MESIGIVIIALIINLSIGFSIYFFVERKRIGKKKSDQEIEKIKRGFNKSIEKPKSLINSTLNKAKKSIERKISKSYLTGCSWIITNELNEHVLFTFRNNNELLITTDGIVKRGEYELIIDNNSILITKDNITEHYNIVNVKDDFIFLNKVSTDSLLFLANSTKFKDELKSVVNKYAKEVYNLENEA